jgi:hypothetical protein
MANRKTATITGIILLMCCSCCGLTAAGSESIRLLLYDLAGGGTFDITASVKTAASLDGITGVASLNAISGEGDEWLTVAGDSEIVFLSTQTFGQLFRLSEQDFRNLFGLDAGKGFISSLTLTGRWVDELLYRDGEYGSYYSFDFESNAFSPYSGDPIPGEYACGFSYTSLSDVGYIFRETGKTFYRPLHGGTDIPVDLELLFGGYPEFLTELEIVSGREVFRFLLAGVMGLPPSPTPTPPDSPTPTPTPPANSFSAVIAMGLGEDIWAVDGNDYSVESGVALTGISPNQIVVQGGEFFIVNSLSHSIAAYDVNTRQLIREMSVKIDDNPTNPMMMAFQSPEIFYVTNYFTDSVSVFQRNGSLVREIPLPEDLPRDSGIDYTRAKPSGLTIVNDRCYVACGNLDNTFTAGGPGIVCEIDTATMEVVSWFESGGRDTVNVNWNPRWPDWVWTINAGDYEPGQGFTGNGKVCTWSISNRSIVNSISVNDAPFEIAFGPDRLYMASARDGVVGRLDLASLELLPPVYLPNSGHGLNFVSGLEIGPDGLVWALEFNHDMVFMLDTTQNDTLVHSLEIGDGPDALAFLQEEGQ